MKMFFVVMPEMLFEANVVKPEPTASVPESDKNFLREMPNMVFEVSLKLQKSIKQNVTRLHDVLKNSSLRSYYSG